ncbi:hypothetical protein PF008_g28619 [Phytophthora fragariae]|uniref:Uncharacterized protein n=1 Tax=Phytophthora fragariae TaxID=53985 RepID=A0A6G0QAS1_9STRA|nr:hypothetical protein PF008_g28619 [Phytophthora fragariae]
MVEGSASLNLSVFRVALGRGGVRDLDWMPAQGYVILKRRSLSPSTLQPFIHAPRGFRVNSSPRNQSTNAAWFTGRPPPSSMRQLKAQAVVLAAAELVYVTL